MRSKLSFILIFLFLSHGRIRSNYCHHHHCCIYSASGPWRVVLCRLLDMSCCFGCRRKYGIFCLSLSFSHFIVFENFVGSSSMSGLFIRLFQVWFCNTRYESASCLFRSFISLLICWVGPVLILSAIAASYCIRSILISSVGLMPGRALYFIIGICCSVALLPVVLMLSTGLDSC